MPDRDRPAAVNPILDRAAGRAIFGGDAGGYHAIRQGYPAALFVHLGERCAARPQILEIGAGSGLATQGLLGLDPRRLTIVESDPDFVAMLQDRFAAAPISVVQGCFPEVELPGPFDLAVCAAAFHWLEPAPALAAVRRLLRSGGIWAMWWNSYLDEDPPNEFATAAMAILRASGVALPPSFGTDGHTSRNVVAQTDLLTHAGFADIQHRQWRLDVRRTPDEARRLFESFSFVRILPEPKRTHLLDRIAQLVETRFAGSAPGWVTTNCYSALG